jgi:hypothetical protein
MSRLLGRILIYSMSLGIDWEGQLLGQRCRSRRLVLFMNGRHRCDGLFLLFHCTILGSVYSIVHQYYIEVVMCPAVNIGFSVVYPMFFAATCF